MVNRIKYILLALLMLKYTEASEGWYNTTMCIANQITSFTPSAAASGDFTTLLDNTIGALALWWIPLGYNIFRYKWNQRKIAEKIAEQPTPNNIQEHYISSFLQEKNFINSIVYDCFQKQQFNNQSKIYFSSLYTTLLVDNYLEDTHHVYYADYVYPILSGRQHYNECCIPEISKIVIEYYGGTAPFTAVSVSDKDTTTCQSLLNDIPYPLTLGSVPIISRNRFPAVLLAGVSRMWYRDK